MNKIISYDFKDNGGRRSGVDRRCFSYSNHIPERRREEERRSSIDRRSGIDRRNESNTSFVDLEMRVITMDRRSAWKTAAV